MYNQAFNNINYNKWKEVRVKKAQTQGFVIEVQLIAYVLALSVAN